MKSEQENLSDAIHEGMRKIANSITPLGVGGGMDAACGRVESLTEACMGMTAGLCRIADAINNLADAVTEHGAIKPLFPEKQLHSPHHAPKWPATASHVCSSDHASADIKATNAEVLS